MEGKLQYAITDGLSVQDVTKDVRTISGRSLLMPQAPFSLRALVMQLFKHTPADTLTQWGFDQPHQDDLLSRLRKDLPFISCPLSGFLDHLLTKAHGIHVKPNTRPPTRKAAPEAEATTIGSDIALTDQLLSFIGAETAATPYGALVDLPTLEDSPTPFKAVVHGQFRFQKLNIIDKFGQVVTAIDPSTGRNFITPCTSQYFSCQARPEGNDSVANSVVIEAGADNEFVQLPPIINHEARINCCFVVRDAPGAPWRPTTEWENPVWGWMVVNYPDRSLQLFYPDGSFYRELSPGRDETSLDSEWIPFEAPPTADNSAHPLLDSLVGLLHSKQNLQDCFTMISEAQDNSPHTPAQYAESLPAVTGKPIALVTTGWSLELASPPLPNQSAVIPTPPSPGLLDYQFKVKVGDKDRAYDGLVGYLDGGVGNQVNIAFDQIFTHFPAPPTVPPASKPVTVGISSDNYPPFRPFFISSLDAVDPGPAGLPNSTQYGLQWTNKLRILGTLMDPYLPVHGYSGVLPMATLRLPPWPVEAAIKKMAAFFKAGPLLLMQDVPGQYAPQYALPDGVDLKDFPVRPTPTIPLAIGGTAAEWHYLQPYPVAGAPGTEEQRLYNAYPTAPSTTTKMTLPAAPYTAVEGYLHLPGQAHHGAGSEG